MQWGGFEAETALKRGLVSGASHQLLAPRRERNHQTILTVDDLK